MERLVPSLETCKRLEDVGYPLDPVSLFYWWQDDEMDTPEVWGVEDIMEDRLDSATVAPTAQEIADQLPEGVITARVQGSISTNRRFTAYHGNYHQTYGGTMSEALAQLYIKLKEVE